MKKTVVKPNLSKFGPIFKGDSPKVKQAIEESDVNEIKQAIANDGKYVVSLDKDYELTSDLLLFEDVEEEISGEKIVLMLLSLHLVLTVLFILFYYIHLKKQTQKITLNCTFCCSCPSGNLSSCKQRRPS